MQVNLRAVVLDILVEASQPDKMCHIVLGNALKKYQYLDKRERSFITRLSLGTIEKRICLDYCIEQFSNTPIVKIKPFIKIVLEMSVYQLLYMDSIPPSAVCNEAVKLVEKRGFRTLKGYVNGVLRNIARNIHNIPFPLKKDGAVAYYSVFYSLPEWLVKLWISQYGEAVFEKIAEGLAQPRKTFVRCNTQRVTPEILMQHLREEGVTVKSVAGLDYALEIEDYDYISGLKAMHNKEFQVQDISSMLAGEGNIITDNSYVVDVCAAPGGKSINAALKAVHGHVDARDCSSQRVLTLQENIKRLGLSNITARVWDATVFDPQIAGQADVVIADLPCSGLGIIGRKPDIKYKMNQEKIKSLVQLQRQILSVATSYVKPGGVLIYSTCTINRAENDENVTWFINEYHYRLTEPPMQIFPGLAVSGIQGGDGFYIARLQKQK